VSSELLEIAGRRTQVLTEGDGPPLLYLHSAAAESAVWMDLLNGLAERLTVHAPLHPGFFDSEGLETVRDVEDLVFHYLDYMDRCGWDSVDVMGCSFGGWIALELAARYPERVDRLVLAGSAGIRLPEVPMEDMFAIQVGEEERARALLFHDPEHPLAKVALPDFGELDDEMLKLFLTAMTAVAKVGWNPYLHDPRLDALLPRVSAETLVVWGAEDRLIPPAYGEHLAERIPNARLELVPDCGHMVWLERPEALLAAALRHLARP
jgi:pimeloyl-ACP methyl ester carboxylesterase